MSISARTALDCGVTVMLALAGVADWLPDWELLLEPLFEPQPARITKTIDATTPNTIAAGNFSASWSVAGERLQPRFTLLLDIVRIFAKAWLLELEEAGKKRRVPLRHVVVLRGDGRFIVRSLTPD